MSTGAGDRSGQGMHPEADASPSVVRHEEELAVGVEPERVGSIEVRKHVATEHVEEAVPRTVERLQQRRVPAGESDSGRVETLPDGSLSIPVLEEELVVTKRVVVRERIVIGKETVTEVERIEADLRRERVEVETTGADAERSMQVSSYEGRPASEQTTEHRARIRRLEESEPGLLDDFVGYGRRPFTETKPFFLTSEFLTFVGTMTALAIALALNNRVNGFRGWLLLAIVASAYIVSRGIAKAGSREPNPRRRADRW